MDRFAWCKMACRVSKTPGQVCAIFISVAEISLWSLYCWTSVRDAVPVLMQLQALYRHLAQTHPAIVCVTAKDAGSSDCILRQMISGHHTPACLATLASEKAQG